MTNFLVSTFAYLIAYWYGHYWLVKNDFEISGFTRFIVVNAFAFLVSYVVSLPFPSLFSI